ncbi:hypothetical protein [Frankia sp. KB5]|uniref:hypothetical protein n=1 Tax=Frankia sp. KB5 TaxID=683318 RepID=UPI001056C223|nr:hypothetical protein [Frankia sp. KB5]
MVAVRRIATTSCGPLAFAAFEASSQTTISALLTASVSTDHCASVRTVRARTSGTAATVGGKCSTAMRIVGDGSAAVMPSPLEWSTRVRLSGGR